MHLIDIMKKTSARMEAMEVFLSKCILFAMIAIISLQIFLRYILNRPLTWPEEISSFLLIWLAYFVADVLFKRHGHVELDFLVKSLKPKQKTLLSLTINSLIGVFLVFLVYSSIQLETLQINHIVGAATKIPKAYYTLPTTVCGLSMLLSAVVFEVEYVGRLASRTGES
jgi:TRAP-type C4-dicarboxylate transport system permease small subunit